MNVVIDKSAASWCLGRFKFNKNVNIHTLVSANRSLTLSQRFIDELQNGKEEKEPLAVYMCEDENENLVIRTFPDPSFLLFNDKIKEIKKRWNTRDRIDAGIQDHISEIKYKYQLYKNKQLPWDEVMKELTDLYIISACDEGDVYGWDDQFMKLQDDKDLYFLKLYCIQSIESHWFSFYMSKLLRSLKPNCDWLDIRCDRFLEHING